MSAVTFTGESHDAEPSFVRPVSRADRRGADLTMQPSSPPLFRGRTDAGLTLGMALDRVLGPASGRRNVVVLGLARGGVAVAREVAAVLAVPLDVLVTRKLGVPGMAEVSLGTIAEGTERIVAEPGGGHVGVPREVVAGIAARERAEVARRVQAYRAGAPRHDVRDRVVVLVDDGIATGATMRAAARELRAHRPTRIIAAVPVASAEGFEAVRREVDDVVAVVVAPSLGAVSAWYREFPVVGDADVERLLGHATPGESDGAWNADGERAVTVHACDGVLAADVGVPRDARGLVVLAHGNGRARHGYRNRYVAGRLRHAGFATLRVDLLTIDEQQSDAAGAAVHYDVPRLATRLTCLCDWAMREGLPGANRVGLLGAGTSAAVSLVVAARRSSVSAVVTRGGRVDLADHRLQLVRVPTLLVVGAADTETLHWNRAALHQLGGHARLAVIARAGHTFEEPGTLGTMAEHAVRWFDRYSAAERPRLTAVAASQATLARVAGLFAGIRSR